MRVIAAIALLVVGLTNPVFAADSFVAAEGAATSSIDMDTPGGHSSTWVIPNIGSANALRASLKIESIYKNSKSLAVAQISIRSSDETAKLRFKNIDDSTFEASLLQYKNKELVSTQRLGTTLKIGESVEIFIGWTSDGLVIVKAGNQDSYTVALGQPVKSLEIANSSCEAIFDPFALGRSGS